MIKTLEDYSQKYQKPASDEWATCIDQKTYQTLTHWFALLNITVVHDAPWTLKISNIKKRQFGVWQQQPDLKPEHMWESVHVLISYVDATSHVKILVSALLILVFHLFPAILHPTNTCPPGPSFHLQSSECPRPLTYLFPLSLSVPLLFKPVTSLLVDYLLFHCSHFCSCPFAS